MHENGAILIIGGLNNPQKAFRPLAERCSELIASNALAGVLPGRPERCTVSIVTPPLDLPIGETYETCWQRIVGEQINILRADRPNRPIHAIGYSLGALLLLRHLIDAPGTFTTLTLLAPPLRVRLFGRILRVLLAPFSDRIRAIPSFNDEEFRECATTPTAAYVELFRLAASISRSEIRRVSCETPLLLVLAHQDELVHSSDVSRSILGCARMLWIGGGLLREERQAPRRRAHLLFTERALGAERWRILCGTVADHMQRGPQTIGPEKPPTTLSD